MSRSRMLARLSCSGADPVPLPASRPSLSAFSEPAEAFSLAAARAGAHCWLVRDREALQQALSRVLSLTGAVEIAWELEPSGSTCGMEYRLRDPQAIQRGHLLSSRHPGGRVRLPLLIHSRPFRRECLKEVELAGSFARAGIVQTGTVVLETGPGRGRLLSCLAPAHLVLVSVRNLVDNASQLFDQIRPGSCASLTTLVTGPSRTADVEETLVTGVHGPKQLFLLLTP